MGKFIMLKKPSPKKITNGIHKSAAKSVPRPSQLQNLSLDSSSANIFHGKDAIHAFVCKYASNGKLYSQWHASGPLYVVNLQCDMRPSPLLFMKRMITAFAQVQENVGVKESEKESTRRPSTFEDMARELKATYNYCGRQTIDEDDVGFVVSRSAFYVSNVKTFFLYFDELMHWRSTYVDEKENLYKLDWIPKIIMHVESRIDIEISKADGLKCILEKIKFDTVQDIIFQVPPPTNPPRICVIYLDMVDDKIVHIRIGGNTKPYQQQLASLKIHGMITKQSPNDFNGNVSTVIKNVSISFQLKHILFTLMGPKGLCGSPVVIRLSPTSENISLLRRNVSMLFQFQNVRIDF